MIKVNLKKDRISEEQVESKLKLIQNKIEVLSKSPILNQIDFLILLAVSIGLTVFIYLFESGYEKNMINRHELEMEKLKLEYESINRQVVALEPIKEELKNYEDKKNAVTTMINFIKKMEQDRIVPERVLEALTESMPKRIWLNNLYFKWLDFGTTSGPATVQIDADSLNVDDVSDFVEKLDHSIFFSNIRLVDVNEAVTKDKVKIKKFNITATPIADIKDSTIINKN